MTTEAKPRCLACQRGSDDVPLLGLTYKGEALSICPEHLPVLIHDPQQLIGQLADADRLRPSDYHD